MFRQGDWVTIKYGEYQGRYGKVSAVHVDGSCMVIPYNGANEPGQVISLDDSGLSLIEPRILSRTELENLMKARVMYRDIAPEVFPAFNIRAGGTYRLEPEDIVEALRNINRRTDPLGEFKEWFWLIQNLFYEDLQIRERYDEDEFSDAPETEDQLFSTVFSLTERLYWRLEERFVSREDTEKYIVRFDEETSWDDNILTNTGLEETAYKAVCEDIAGRVRTFEYNRQRPRKEWVYCPSQKRHIINSYESEEALADTSRQEQALYRKCVKDLFALNDTQAMKILAWGYLEGSAVYRQNFRLAERYLLKLYQKTGDAYAANALGGLYYEGLTRKGEPDYEKAFFYYSYGALAGIDESIYSCGDMLIHGQGTVRNIDTGMNLIVDGYKDTMYRFSEGEFDNRFADYALKMGNICRENIILGMGARDAYKFYLEAQFAIRKRRKAGGFFRDEVVEEKISQAIQNIRETYQPDPDRNVLKADFPIYISHLFEDRFPIRITIGQDPSGYFLKMSRFRLVPGDTPRILVTFPELSYVNLVSELTFRLEDVGVVKVPDSGETFLTDGFTKNENTNALEFYSGGECIAAIEAKWFVIDVAKEKMLMKMSPGSI
ncbi:MAG: sel1 repeat family protein [Parasporobacterium sp.]|nr:sel1 repeat family protein [Parasporobacterium sp.]